VCSWRRRERQPSSAALGTWAAPRPTPWDTLLFAAKEATYKAWYPLTGVVLHHEQVRVQLTADGTFRAEASDGIRMPLRVQGRWRAGPDVVRHPCCGGSSGSSSRRSHASNSSRCGEPLTDSTHASKSAVVTTS
jgi:hypothetical protein